MAQNGYGELRTTRKKIMADHDALPAPLRWISANAVAKWAASSIELTYRMHRASGKPHDLALRATAADLRREEAADTLKDYGPAHPEAPPRRDPRKARQ
jgi:hypothetical protein